MQRVSRIRGLLLAWIFAGCGAIGSPALSPRLIADAADTKTIVAGDVVRIQWSRDDVTVKIDGVPFPPSAGLTCWAAFKPSGHDQDAIVMGDTVVFQDEVDAAMDAVFEQGLKVTALHNHFFYDEPNVYFMHISGRGSAQRLAAGVKAVWDAIKRVRADNPQLDKHFSGGSVESTDQLDVKKIESVTGLTATAKPGNVIKISTGQTALLDNIEVGAAMGLSSWAAFSGSDELAVMDGDFIMTADQVQPVLKALRDHGVHIVALHNHMIAEQPTYYFAHFWGKGSVTELANGFKAALARQR